MNIKLNGFRDGKYAGGVMSRFMWMLPNAIGYDPDNIYFQSYDERWNCGNGFEWVFNQWYDGTFIDIECENKGMYLKMGKGHGALEHSPDYRRLKNLCTKIRFREEVTNVVREYENNLAGALGVHVRTGDMNITHPEMGNFTTWDFIVAMRELRPSRVFIAADNNDSIIQIRDEVENRFSHKCDIVYIPDLIREAKDTFEDDYTQRNNMQKPEFWQQVFIEALLLSRCSSLLCRVSNVPNVAMLFSRTIKKIHRL